MAAIVAFAKSYFTWFLKNLVYALITVGIAGVIAGSVGGYYGWKLKGKVVEIKTIESVKEVLVEDATALNAAREKGAALQRDNDKLRDLNRQLGDMLAKNIPATPTEVSNDANCPDLSRHIRLSHYAVGVLNRALSGSAADPEGWSDEEKRALATVGLLELSQKIREVAGQYRELAANHDALVDDVAAFQKKQLERRARQ